MYKRQMLVASDKRFIYEFIKVVSEAGIEVVDIMHGALADYANFDTSLDSKTGALINLDVYKRQMLELQRLVTKLFMS